MAKASGDRFIVRATPSFESVAKRFKSLSKNLRQYLREEAHLELRGFYNDLRASAPRGQHWNLSGEFYQTDELKRSMKLQLNAGGTVYGSVRIDGSRAGAKHARWVIHGTRPHRIPKTGRTGMTFYWPRVTAEHADYLLKHQPKKLQRKGRKQWNAMAWGDKVIRLTYVNHPGQKANDFPKRVYQLRFPTFRYHLQEGLKRAVKLELKG